MEIQIRGVNVEVSELLRTHVSRRLDFALGRVAEIGQVLVRLSHTRGDRGGVDKRCQMELGQHPRIVRVEGSATNLFAAVNHASHRLKRAATQALGREHA